MKKASKILKDVLSTAGKRKHVMLSLDEGLYKRFQKAVGKAPVSHVVEGLMEAFLADLKRR